MPIDKMARAESERFLSAVQDGHTKVAANAATAYTRVRMREEGILRRNMDLEILTADDLDKQLDDSGWVKIYELEPDSPGAISTPFAAFSPSVWIRGRRYPVQLQRIQTQRYQCDVAMLKTWDADLRQIVSDNSIKDILYHEDSFYINLIHSALIGADQNVPWSGIPQWVTIAGGVDRDNAVEATNIMGRTDAHVEPSTGLMNNVTWREFMKWQRSEVGGDMAQDFIKNGFHEQEWLDITWTTTIKRDLVPDNRWYMFGPQEFMGHFVGMDDTTMFVKVEAWMLEFFAYEILGLSFGHTAALAIAQFEP